MDSARVANEQVIADTGPLVALLAVDDAKHPRCVELSKSLAKPFFTTWPVLTEAAWLLRSSDDAIPRLIGLINQGLIRPVDLAADSVSMIPALAQKYASLSPQLADLTLVSLAEQLGVYSIFTLDYRDFTVYRDIQGRPFRLIS